MQAILRSNVRMATREYSVPRFYRNMLKLNRKWNPDPDQQFYTRELLKLHLRCGSSHDQMLAHDHLAQFWNKAIGDIRSHPQLSRLETLIQE